MDLFLLTSPRHDHCYVANGPPWSSSSSSSSSSSMSLAPSHARSNRKRNEVEDAKLLQQRLLSKEQNAAFRKRKMLHLLLVRLQAHHLHVERVRRLGVQQRLELSNEGENSNFLSNSISSRSRSTKQRHHDRVEDARRRARKNIELRVERARSEVERAKSVARRVREERRGGGGSSSEDRAGKGGMCFQRHDRQWKSLNISKSTTVYSLTLGTSGKMSTSSRVDSARDRARRKLFDRAERARREVNRAKSVARRVRDAEARTSAEGKIAREREVGHAHRRMQEKLLQRVKRAKHEVEKAKLVARRVRAVKVLQRMARTAQQRERLRRIDVSSEVNRCSCQPTGALMLEPPILPEPFTTPELRGAVTHLISVFPQGGSDCFSGSFDSASVSMQSDVTMRAATSFLRYLQLAAHGYQRHGRQRHFTLSPRWFLSAMLIGTFPRETLGLPEEADEDQSVLRGDQKATLLLNKRLGRAARGIASGVHHMHRRLCSEESGTLESYEYDEKEPGKGRNVPSLRDILGHTSAFRALFETWKDRDRDVVVKEMMRVNVDAWKAYIHAKKQLQKLFVLRTQQYSKDDGNYLASSVDSFEEELQAQLKGSRTFLKKIRNKWNAFLGDDRRGWQMMKDCKTKAEEMLGLEGQNERKSMERERYGGKAIHKEATQEENRNIVDECGGRSASLRGSYHPVAESPCEERKKKKIVGAASEFNASPNFMSPSTSFANVTSNAEVVHTILLSDEEKLRELSWDGMPRGGTVSFTRFANWYETQSRGGRPERCNEGKVEVTEKQEAGANLTSSVASATVLTNATLASRIAAAMECAFFDSMQDDLKRGEFASYQSSVDELYGLVRELIPTRTDLDSSFKLERCGNGTDVSFRALLSPLLLAAKALVMVDAVETSSFTQGKGQAGGTSEWVVIGEERLRICETRSSSLVTQTGQPKTEAKFLVTSLAYLFHQERQCRRDVCNAHLALVAPHIQSVGVDYERYKFQSVHGPFDSLTAKDQNGSSSSRKIPQTIAWLRRTLQCKGFFCEQDGLNKEPATVAARQLPSKRRDRLNLVKSYGFVDELLLYAAMDGGVTTDENCRSSPSYSFWRLETSVRVMLPEVLVIDSSRMDEIRRVAKAIVTASALVIHAYNAANVSSSKAARCVSYRSGENVDHAEIRSESDSGKADFKSRAGKERLIEALLGRSRPRRTAGGKEGGCDEDEDEEDLWWCREIADAVVMIAADLVMSDQHNELSFLATSSQGGGGDTCQDCLTQESERLLRSRTVAVLRGNDPVLKLLESRVKQFFRFVCKYEPRSSAAGSRLQQHQQQAPFVMKTGRPFMRSDTEMKGGYSRLTEMTPKQMVPSSEKGFGVGDRQQQASWKDVYKAAEKEAVRRGFFLFQEELAEAGLMAHKIVTLMIDIYGGCLLDRLMLELSQSNNENTKKSEQRINE